MAKSETPFYLGDGAYVKLNEYGQIVLFTSDGVTTTNTICFEPELLLAFQEWLRRNGL